MSETVKGLLVNAETDVIVVNTKTGSQPAFLLHLKERGSDGAETTHSFVVPPEQLQALCSLVHETLHAQGYAIPALPDDLSGPAH